MMTEGSQSEFQKLMAMVGTLILHWGFLEAALDDDIRRLRQANGEANPFGPRGTLGNRLKEWRELNLARRSGLPKVVADQAEEIALLGQIRNLVAHDLAGASALPEDEEPHIWCVNRVKPKVKGRRISLSELTATTEAIDSCRRRFKLLATDRKFAN